MLNKHNLAIAEFSGSRSRYSLDVILVTSKETVATDGVALVKVSAANTPAQSFPQYDGFRASDDFKPFLLRADAAKDAVKLLPKKTSLPALQCVAVDASKTDTGKETHLLITDMEQFHPLHVKKVEGQFPNYEAIFPKSEPLFSVRVNASYLKRLAQSAASFSEAIDPGLTIHYYGHGQPLRLEAHREETQQEWTALLMPLRDDSPAVPEPDPTPVPVRAALPPGPEETPAENGTGTIFLLPAQKLGAVRVQAPSLESAIESYEEGLAEFDWLDDDSDDPELIRPAFAAVEGTDEILEETK